jgi:hypothetical protein
MAFIKPQNGFHLILYRFPRVQAHVRPSSRNSCSHQSRNGPRLSTPPIAKHQSLSCWRPPQWPLLLSRHILSFWVCNSELIPLIPNMRLISARNSAQASRQVCNIAPSFSSTPSLYRGRLRHLCIKGNKYALPKSPSLKTPFHIDSFDFQVRWEPIDSTYEMQGLEVVREFYGPGLKDLEGLWWYLRAGEAFRVWEELR